MSAFLGDEYRDLQAVAAKFKDAYKNAEPFPSIYFDNVFDEEKLNEILTEFPDLSKKYDAVLALVEELKVRA